MCDYSLMTFPNRLANEGETLVTHKFSTGSIGFVSPMELGAAPTSPQCTDASVLEQSEGLVRGRRRCARRFLPFASRREHV